jgi:MHS family proline/betaine transporter-like MFS transporter
MAVSYDVSVALFAGTRPMINAWLMQLTGNRMIPACYLIAATVIGVIPLACCVDRTGGPMRGEGRSVD